jgi:tetratricopeptide (TPR) repeat protein
MMTGEELNADAYAARQEGRHDEALDLYDQAVNAFDTEGLPLRSAHALRHVADLQRELGNLDAARESIEGVLQTYRDEDVPALELANTQRVGALIAEAEGRTQEARAFWREAGRLYNEAGVVDGIPQAERRKWTDA